ncbi:hypothetical protein Btru_059088 [Bulinus truncatus]|nr:hypothetical protein Btru_059088 [Bulinus truncatus]
MVTTDYRRQWTRRGSSLTLAQACLQHLFRFAIFSSKIAYLKAMDSQEQTPKQRINMSHGFMKSVIRNQIDRDNYDKEVKAKQQMKSHIKLHKSKPKKPEIQTYVPPQRSKKDSHLFTLEYEHKNGAVYTVNVFKYDRPEEVAKSIGDKFDLTEAFIDALTLQINQEMLKRVN